MGRELLAARFSLPATPESRAGTTAWRDPLRPQEFPFEPLSHLAVRLRENSGRNPGAALTGHAEHQVRRNLQGDEFLKPLDLFLQA